MNQQIDLEKAYAISEEGVTAFRHLLDMDTSRSRDYINLMAQVGLNLGEIQQAVPQKVIPQIALAQYYHENEELMLAAATYLESLNYIDVDSQTSAMPFFKAAAFFSKQKQPDQAIEILQQGITRLPQNPRLRVRLARLYEIQGISFRAIEEYRHALILDPTNKTALKRLTALQQDSGEV